MQGIEQTLDAPLADAEVMVRNALAEEGFGVLTEIDVAATLKAKLGVERPPLKILGACNPALAQRALEVDPSVALVLPCNVVLEEASGNQTRVTLADPRQLLSGDRLGELAEEAVRRLDRVSERLAASK
jgi:uncharacterized protein (DUF302 family)